MNELSRRSFLRAMATGSGATLLAACGGEKIRPQPTAEKSETVALPKEATIFPSPTITRTTTSEPTSSPTPVPTNTLEPSPTPSPQEKETQDHGKNALLGVSLIDPQTMYQAVAVYRRSKANDITGVLEGYRSSMNIDIAYILGIQEGSFGLHHQPPHDPENVGNLVGYGDFKTLRAGTDAMVREIMSYPVDHSAHTFRQLIPIYAGDFFDERIEAGEEFLQRLRDLSNQFKQTAVDMNDENNPLAHAIKQVRAELRDKYLRKKHTHLWV